ncbi:MAG: IS982 family transposase [Chitinophagales bacterium]
MHNLKNNFDKILEVIKSIGKEILDKNGNFFKRSRLPKLSDVELVSLNLTAEYMGIDSENNLFIRLKSVEFPNLIDRSGYNRRRRGLYIYIEQIRRLLANQFNEFEDIFVVDSMPLEICKLSRSQRSSICQQDLDLAPDKGYCASMKMSYYGYKLHATCGVAGIIESIDISSASVHDIHYLNDIRQQFSNCIIIADKGYLSQPWQLELFTENNIELSTPMRNNQKNYKQYPYIFRKARKRIETLFSQLCDQFMIRRNYAKSFAGFRTRVISKITALTTIQYLNKYILDRKINNLKAQI